MSTDLIAKSREVSAAADELAAARAVVVTARRLKQAYEARCPSCVDYADCDCECSKLLLERELAKDANARAVTAYDTAFKPDERD
jgi:hypothetical protein